MPSDFPRLLLPTIGSFLCCARLRGLRLIIISIRPLATSLPPLAFPPRTLSTPINPAGPQPNPFPRPPPPNPIASQRISHLVARERRRGRGSGIRADLAGSARNDWINSYLEAILDASGTAGGISTAAKERPRAPVLVLAPGRSGTGRR